MRQRLGFQLISELKREDGTLPLVQLAPEWEQTFTTYQLNSDRGPGDVALPPEDFNRLANSIAERIARAGADGIYPALVTSTGGGAPAHRDDREGHRKPGLFLRGDRDRGPAIPGRDDPGMNAVLAEVLALGQGGLMVAGIVFLRVGAAMALLPAFGERSIPERIRLVLALAFTAIVFPAVAAPCKPRSTPAPSWASS